MTPAKRGAQVAIRSRMHAIQCSCTSPRAAWEVEVEDGPMGAFAVKPRIEMAADTTAHIHRVRQHDGHDVHVIQHGLEASLNYSPIPLLL